MLKTSPISAITRKQKASMFEVEGWQMAENFGSTDKENEHLISAAVLADWSHVGKISVRGEGAVTEVSQLNILAAQCAPLHACSSADMAILRLVDDEFLILTQPGQESRVLNRLNSKVVSVFDQTGSLGCFALAGPRREEVMERSCAMNLRREAVGTGAVVQTTIHMVNVTFYRTASMDIMLPQRDLAQSLYESMMDVGEGVGMIPAGLGIVPVSFEKDR